MSCGQRDSLRFASQVAEMSFGTAAAFQLGLSGFLSAVDLIHSIEQECCQNDEGKWAEEYEYVVGGQRLPEKDTGRDAGHEGMGLGDFVKLDVAVAAELSTCHVATVRMYTGLLRSPWNRALRALAGIDNGTEARAHLLKWATCVSVLSDALLRLSAASSTLTVWRGVDEGVLKLPPTFCEASTGFGCVELAFMSTTADIDVAFSTAGSSSAGRTASDSDDADGTSNNKGKCVFEIEVKENRSSGTSAGVGVGVAAHLEPFSQYPAEREWVFPPFVHLCPTSHRQEGEVKIIQVQATVSTKRPNLAGLDLSSCVAQPNSTAQRGETVHFRPPTVYKNFSLDLVKNYKYGHQINLNYPGLQLVHLSEITRSPIYVVKHFLTDAECDALKAKLNFVERTNRKLESSTCSSGTAGVAAPKRTSTHVRVARRETVGIHQKIADLTAHKPENMESLKVIHYERGGQFEAHTDAQGNSVDDLVDLQQYADDGVTIPVHCNRELTCFVYLSEVEDGGETAFFKDPWQQARTNVRKQDFSGETFRACPEKGMAVLFYATFQPDKPEDIPPISGGMARWDRPDGRIQVQVQEEMIHAGLPVRKGTKDLMACWIWPPYVNRAVQDEDGNNLVFSYTDADRATDGVML